MTASTIIDDTLFHPLIGAGLRKLGINDPNELQKQAWPQMLMNNDILLKAPTGSGKTAAYAAPVLHRLVTASKDRVPQAPTALILVPTRELGAQIVKVCRQIVRPTPIRSLLICGGASSDKQIDALREGVDLVVATPGRLLDLLLRGYCHLESVQVLVIDEVDEMLNPEFLEEMRQIHTYLPRKRQTILCSATMPPKATALAKSFLKNPVRVETERELITPARLHQRAFFAEQDEKFSALASLLKTNEGRQLVFFNTRAAVDLVGKKLAHAGLAVATLHGLMTQSSRQKAIASFRSGQAQCLLTTDLAARGLDIDDIRQVINYDIPHKPETYIHRIGRTARGGKRGFATSLCSREERLLLRAIEKTSGKLRIISF